MSADRAYTTYGSGTNKGREGCGGPAAGDSHPPNCVSCHVRIAVFIVGAVLLAAMGTQAAEAAKPLRVLVTYGIHPFPEKEFFAMWDALPGIQYTKAKMPHEMGLLKPGLEKQYDVLLRYDQMLTTTPEQQEAFAGLLKAGIGFVALHHNLCAHDDWDEYRKITGMLFVRQPRVVDGKAYELSTYAEDIDFDVSVTDARHPITSGLKSFTLHDEVYGKCWVAPGIHVLMTTEHPGSNRPVGWTTIYGKSPVFSFVPGHGERAFADANFRQLLLRGIRWAADERAALSQAARPEKPEADAK